MGSLDDQVSRLVGVDSPHLALHLLQALDQLSEVVIRGLAPRPLVGVHLGVGHVEDREDQADVTPLQAIEVDPPLIPEAAEVDQAGGHREDRGPKLLEPGPVPDPDQGLQGHVRWRLL